jgi:hypothetical protein
MRTGNRSEAMMIQSGTFTFDASTFPQLSNPNPPSARTAQDFIVFPVGFAGVPKVSVSLNRLDVSGERNTRVVVGTDTITDNGFELVLSTWWDTTLFSAGVSWIAYEN